ncbi:MAG TPA: SulP family inorganic anion transporter, partial [Pirellulaceae bacterium]|nr:SulP family inorganic anion transporter [Pirellulaceae bacterium]
MDRSNDRYDLGAFGRDLIAGIVVYLVALPLCLGIANASGAPAISGLIAGAIGGLVVGLISGSHSSVSGPAAGLAAVVLLQIRDLGSFETFLVAVVIGGLVQLVIGIGRLGFIAGYFPTSVIKGLLAAIGILLIIKQTPHLFGHAADKTVGEAAAHEAHGITWVGFDELLSHLHAGGATIGLVCIALLIVWDRFPKLKKSPIPAPLIVVVLGVSLQLLLARLGSGWAVTGPRLVSVPVAANWSDLGSFVTWPDFTAIARTEVWIAGLTIAAVASLETLLNIEAVDKIDPRKRVSPPNRELIAQGVGNVFSGLFGGIPITSVVVRSSVNLEAKARSKVSAIWHGLLIVATVVLLPSALNAIPIACLAAILVHTGFKLAHPKICKSLLKAGPSQYVPFLVTIGGIVAHDLLFGVGLGLATSLLFELARDLKMAPHVIHEKHLAGEVTRIELAPQVSFLNRAALARTLHAIPSGSSVVLDARKSEFIDPDCLGLLQDFRNEEAVARGLTVRTIGFRDQYRIADHVDFVDLTARDLQQRISPDQVLELLKQGNARFRAGRSIQRDLVRQVDANVAAPFPIVAFLGCIDARTPTELIFDLGLGDALTVRVAGNVAGPTSIGSLEYATATAGAKLIVVLGHSRCGAISAALDRIETGE